MKRRVENDKLRRNGKTILRSLCSPTAQSKWKWHGQGWWETFSTFCRLKSSLSFKGECRGGIACGTRPSLCQRDPVGTSTLPTERQVLRQAHLSTEMKETTVLSFLVPFLMALNHMQTWDPSATLIRAPVCYTSKLFESLPLQATSPHFGPSCFKYKPLSNNIIYIMSLHHLSWS